jgi:hypothetical protein
MTKEDLLRKANLYHDGLKYVCVDPECHILLDNTENAIKCRSCAIKKILNCAFADHDNIYHLIVENFLTKEQWTEKRREDLKTAIIKKMNNNCEIPTEYVTEYNEIHQSDVMAPDRLAKLIDKKFK